MVCPTDQNAKAKLRDTAVIISSEKPKVPFWVGVFLFIILLVIILLIIRVVYRAIRK